MKQVQKFSRSMLTFCCVLLLAWSGIGVFRLFEVGMTDYVPVLVPGPFLQILDRSRMNHSACYQAELAIHGANVLLMLTTLVLVRFRQHTAGFLVFSFSAGKSLLVLMDLIAAKPGWPYVLYLGMELLCCLAALLCMLAMRMGDDRLTPGSYPHVNADSDTLVVYFSREGYTRKLAYHMAELLRANICEIRTEQTVYGFGGFFRCAMCSLSGRDMPILTPEIPWERYRRFVLCAPVWGLRCAAPMRSFCRLAKGRMETVNYLITHLWRVNFAALFEELDSLLGLRHDAAQTVALHIGRAVWPGVAHYYSGDRTEGWVRVRQKKDAVYPARTALPFSQILGKLFGILRGTGKTLFLVLFVTCIGLYMWDTGIRPMNMIGFYIIGVLTMAITFGDFYCIFLFSFCSLVCYNFFFVAPIYTLSPYQVGFSLSFLMILTAGVIALVLTGRLKRQTLHAETVAYRTSVLLETTQLLQKERDESGMIAATAGQLMKIYGKAVVAFSDAGDGTLRRELYNMGDQDGADPLILDDEAMHSLWEQFAADPHASSVSPDKEHLFLPIRTPENFFGMLCIAIQERSLTALERSMASSIAEECALVLERELYNRKRQEAAIQVQNEQVRTNFLRAISHDLRTPLTSISGSAQLLAEDSALPPERRRRLSADIYEDSLWLIDLVENLLSVTRMGDGGVELRLRPELLDDVVQEATGHLKARCTTHRIVVLPSEECFMARMDARLIMQVLMNLLTNAVKYTPQGSTITVSTDRQGDWVRVFVADEGPGVPEENREKIFDLFYTANTLQSDSRRGIGLGLSLCRTIISAHGGEITVSENHPRGAVFTFTLPVMELPSSAE